MLIILIGNVGSGKTTLAKNSAKHFGWEYFDVDAIKKKLFPKFKDYSKFTALGLPMPPNVKLQLYREIAEQFTNIGRNRVPVIMDETFHTKLGRTAFLNQAKKHFKKVYVIEIRVHNTIAKNRLSKIRNGHILQNPWKTRQAIAKETQPIINPDLTINNNTSLQKAQKQLNTYLKTLIA